jgi:hypothetical protein
MVETETGSIAGGVYWATANPLREFAPGELSAPVGDADRVPEGWAMDQA